jgi:deoxyribonuclease-4
MQHLMPTGPRTGFHLGLAAGYDAALAYARMRGCTTVQIFTHNPRSFSFKELDHDALDHLKAGWKEHDIRPVFSHCNYLINLGSSESKTFYGSLNTMKKELEYARAFGCDYFVLHVGKHKEAGLEAGMRQVAKAINKLREEILKYKVMILFETVAGAGTEIGAKFEELSALIDMIDPELQEYIGVAVDTCHIFAAGYDISTKEGVERTISGMEKSFGLGRIKLIHVNDSKGEFGGHLDRHEHIGQGRIGLEGMHLFLNHPRIREIPMILETPVDDRGDDQTDLDALNRLLK